APFDSLPVLPLIQVAAPVLLFQLGLTITACPNPPPYDRVVNWDPTSSNATLPTTLFAAPITPPLVPSLSVPLVPFIHVTAPALVAVPKLLQFWVLNRRLPLAS